MKTTEKGVYSSIFIAYLVFLCALMACNKIEDIAIPEIEVILEAVTFTEGELVSFMIKSRSADYILFYSGEPGCDYHYASVPKIYPATVNLAFSTRLEGGNQLSNILNVKYSANFSGEYTKKAVKEAQWIDITDKFILPNSIQSDVKPSGTLNITDLFKENSEALYFAFQYRMEPYDAGLNNERTCVYIYDFDIKAHSEFGEKDIVNQSMINWKLIRYGDGYDDDPFGPQSNSSRIVFKTSPKPAASREAWAISPAIVASPQLVMPLDRPITVKDYLNPEVQIFQHTFEKAGEYEFVFIASNTSVKGNKETIISKKIKINSLHEIQNTGETEPIDKEEF